MFSALHPISYLLACDEIGYDKYYKYCNVKPCPNLFDHSVLIKSKKSNNNRMIPYNPMINAGGIMSCSLISNNNKSFSERFEKYLKILNKLIGNIKDIGYDNKIYSSQKNNHSNPNWKLIDIMNEYKSFPKNTNLKQTLQFYFRLNSLLMNTEMTSIMIATIANNGCCPITQQKVFQNQSMIQKCINLLRNCTMYNKKTYDGKWPFHTNKLPTKSSISGVIYCILPNNVGSLAVYSPFLDKHGQSIRGKQFIKRFLIRWQQYLKYRSMNYDNKQNIADRHLLSLKINKTSLSRKKTEQTNCVTPTLTNNTIATFRTPQPLIGRSISEFPPLSLGTKESMNTMGSLPSEQTVQYSMGIINKKRRENERYTNKNDKQESCDTEITNDTMSTLQTLKTDKMTKKLKDLSNFDLFNDDNSINLHEPTTTAPNCRLNRQYSPYIDDEFDFQHDMSPAVPDIIDDSRSNQLEIDIGDDDDDIHHHNHENNMTTDVDQEINKKQRIKFSNIPSNSIGPRPVLNKKETTTRSQPILLRDRGDTYKSSKLEMEMTQIKEIPNRNHHNSRSSMISIKQTEYSLNHQPNITRITNLNSGKSMRDEQQERDEEEEEEEAEEEEIEEIHIGHMDTLSLPLSKNNLPVDNDNDNDDDNDNDTTPNIATLKTLARQQINYNSNHSTEQNNHYAMNPRQEFMNNSPISIYSTSIKDLMSIHAQYNLTNTTNMTTLANMKLELASCGGYNSPPMTIHQSPQSPKSQRSVVTQQQQQYVYGQLSKQIYSAMFIMVCFAICFIGLPVSICYLLAQYKLTLSTPYNKNIINIGFILILSNFFGFILIMLNMIHSYYKYINDNNNNNNFINKEVVNYDIPNQIVTVASLSTPISPKQQNNHTNSTQKNNNNNNNNNTDDTLDEAESMISSMQNISIINSSGKRSSKPSSIVDDNNNNNDKFDENAFHLISLFDYKWIFKLIPNAFCLIIFWYCLIKCIFNLNGIGYSFILSQHITCNILINWFTNQFKMSMKYWLLTLVIIILPLLFFLDENNQNKYYSNYQSIKHVFIYLVLIPILFIISLSFYKSLNHKFFCKVLSKNPNHLRENKWILNISSLIISFNSIIISIIILIIENSYFGLELFPIFWSSLPSFNNLGIIILILIFISCINIIYIKSDIYKFNSNLNIIFILASPTIYLLCSIVNNYLSFDFRYLILSICECCVCIALIKLYSRH